jgi:hypothetical protein
MTAALLALFLHAISAVESGGNAHAIGAAGERGEYQMTPAAVAEFGGCDTAAATRKVRRIEAAFAANHITPTPFLLAASWNGGTGAVIRGRIQPGVWVYAQRVVNLMEARK